MACAKDPVETAIIRVRALELLRFGVGIGPPGSTHPTCPLLGAVGGCLAGGWVSLGLLVGEWLPWHRDAAVNPCGAAR